MGRSLSYLRRVLLGATVVGSLGFGATQAFARNGTETPWYKTCPATGDPYPDTRCAYGCWESGFGYCDARGYCQCGMIP